METLRIQTLRQFLIAAESGSFRTAAAATFRSPASVSTAIRDLETAIGARLFEPGQRARPTPLAVLLRPLFQELVGSHDRALADIRQITNAEAGSLTLAVVPFLAEDWLPPVLTAFISENPGVRVHVSDERSRHIQRLVAEGSVDIGVGAGSAASDKIRYTPILKDAFGVAFSATHPFAANAGPLSWSDLDGERLIGNDAFDALDRVRMAAVIDRTALWISSRPSLMDSLRRNIGVSVLPRLTKPDWAEGVLYRHLVKPKVERTIGIMVRTGQTMPPVAARMIALIDESLRQYGEARARDIGEAIVLPAKAARPPVNGASPGSRRGGVPRGAARRRRSDD